MIRSVLGAMATATSRLLRNWRTLAVFLGLYAALLAVLYLFVVTREASLGQVLFTLTLATLAPGLFFLLQALGVSYTQSEGGLGALLRRALRDSWKLIVISLPLLLLAGLAIYLLGKLQAYALAAPPPPPRPPARNAAPSLPWLRVTFTTLRFLLLCIAFPLATIHLWIATAQEGLGAALQGVGPNLARAFAPRAVLAYAMGLVIFGVVPYFLLFTRTPAQNAWVEIGLLGARLALALLLALLGWVITLGALAKMTRYNSTP